VARQYSGTAGRIENCQIGVFVAYASRHGQALLDRELYLPEEWTKDSARCRLAGISEGRHFATKPQLARQMLARAFAVGIPAQWVTGDSVYGDDRRLRTWLESCPQAYVLAVSGKEYVWLDWQQRQVKTILAALPEEGWARLSAGDGSKGPRWYDWRWLLLADPMEANWRRWLLVRRSISEPSELRAYVAFAPRDATLADLVRVAGSRRGAQLDGLVSPYHAVHVGLGPADRAARRGARRRDPQKKPATSRSAEQPGGLQSPTGARLPLNGPEIRRLLWRLVLVVEQTVEHMVAWSVWRRCHQSLAKYYHYKRRGALTV
jgi:DDE superfamily endonuclease